MSYIDDIVFNENRHLLYNLLDNYSNKGNHFWDNHLHTMLVSCTFSLIYIDMYKRGIPESDYTINSILDFICIPDLTINVTFLESANSLYYINFYYKNKFFAYQRSSNSDTFRNIYREIQYCSYDILKESYSNANNPTFFVFLELIVPTNYSYNEFNPLDIRKILNTNGASNISGHFLEIYGYSGGSVGKINEYIQKGLPNSIEIPIPSYEDIINSSSEFIEKFTQRS